MELKNNSTKRIIWLAVTVIAVMMTAASNAQNTPVPSHSVTPPADTLLTMLQLPADSIVTPVADTLPDLSSSAGRRQARELGLTIYDYPYSIKTRCENWGRLTWNTVAFAGAGLVTLGVLYCLPEDATAWNKSELQHKSFWHRYGDHVADGPVWDKDNFVFNYVLHPYGGAVYYMSARSQGFNMLGSMAYSAFVSTVMWEYGIEAFMEIPSIQDLFVTPLVGTLFGEGFYQIKRRIVANDYCILGSRFLGGLAAWLVDPINEFVSLFAGNPWRHRNGASATLTPMVSHGTVVLGASIVF